MWEKGCFVGDELDNVCWVGYLVSTRKGNLDTCEHQGSVRAASKVLGSRSELALLREQELGKILKPWSMDRVISWKLR